MLVKLPTQTCKSQQVCWLNSHSLDCFRVWICLYFHPPELSLWSQWCSYVIGVSSSISHTYIEAGTPSNDLGMHLYYIYIFIKFLYTYLYWLVELPLFASEITRNHMFPGWLLGFPAKIPQSILLLRLLRSLKSRQNLPWSFSPRLFLCFFGYMCSWTPPFMEQSGRCSARWWFHRVPARPTSLEDTPPPNSFLAAGVELDDQADRGCGSWLFVHTGGLRWVG